MVTNEFVFFILLYILLFHLFCHKKYEGTVIALFLKMRFSSYFFSLTGLQRLSFKKIIFMDISRNLKRVKKNSGRWNITYICWVHRVLDDKIKVKMRGKKEETAIGDKFCLCLITKLTIC